MCLGVFQCTHYIHSAILVLLRVKFATFAALHTAYKLYALSCRRLPAAAKSFTSNKQANRFFFCYYICISSSRRSFDVKSLMCVGERNYNRFGLCCARILTSDLMSDDDEFVLFIWLACLHVYGVVLYQETTETRYAAPISRPLLVITDK